MKVAILYLTSNGKRLGEKLQSAFECDLYGKETFQGSLATWVQKIYKQYEGFIFIMATGIVVRLIAPLLESKQSDPAVVVIDELGRFCISLTGGHLGGANALADKTAKVINAVPVITTATDINEKISFDMLAKKNNCLIENLGELKYISSAILNDDKIGLFSDVPLIGAVPEYITVGVEQKNNVLLSNKKQIEHSFEGHTLILRPKNLILGIGCKKGKTEYEIEKAIIKFLKEHNKSIHCIQAVASIELKKEETGIVEFCKKNQIPFLTLSKERLEAVEKEFIYSDFVKQSVGVGSVAEACAVYAVPNANLLYGKTILDGITIALAEKNVEINVENW